MQSYLSRVFLCFAPASDKLLILVDNRPWLEKKHQTSTQIWKLMVTKVILVTVSVCRRKYNIVIEHLLTPKEYKCEDHL